MRALTVEELGFVSGGYASEDAAFEGLDDFATFDLFFFNSDPSKPKETVRVRAQRRPKAPNDRWGVVICDGDCGAALERLGKRVSDLFEDLLGKPETNDANNDGVTGDTLNCPSGTYPTTVGDGRGHLIRTCAPYRR
jgi:hypothetical protein